MLAILTQNIKWCIWWKNIVFLVSLSEIILEGHKQKILFEVNCIVRTGYTT